MPAKPAPAYPRVRWQDDVKREDMAPLAESDAEDSDALPPTSEGPWQLRGRHFVLSLERVTSILSWNKQSKVKFIDSADRVTERETKWSGVDIAFLGAGGAQRTQSGFPRVAFDGVIGGFTIGGSISYMHTSGSADASFTGAAEELPQADVFVFAPRLGALLTASNSVGVWLRGGFTRTSIAASGTVVTSSGTADVDETATLWNLALEPQLVLVPVPRIGFTLGIVADIALDGLVETRVSGAPNVETAIAHSAYGVSGGLAAIF
jgi:hypothetical protein